MRGAHRPRTAGSPTVHPRVRGEQIKDVPGFHAIEGPSPRAWGSGGDLPASTGPVRPIPTYVGLRDGSDCRSPSSAVHPHVRGEQDREASEAGEQQGPSPRARGAVGP
ncbi:hypothetical protein B005_2178 [Nocardiopsis alba ATCC BAA-2165]|uniref:Uncharacterized protein n=1 Tax=Nocardiopsis alba (strain ATCC BAA-2165 / BE74) TaxID=1205910 RepID=J7KZ41_NOCAA|nr:hypothetical protein B005_2178 [Nocardiopsis alba ATCC BAA-2165]